MARLLIPIAVLIVLAGISYVSYRMGHAAGRARQRKLGESVDPRLVNDLAAFTRNVLNPADPINNMVIMPDRLRKEGDLLLVRIGQLHRNHLYPTE